MACYIIAEAGVNHNGSLNMAKQLISEAKRIGADAVKFQSFKADKVISRNAPKAEYQKVTTNINESQYEMVKKLEFSESSHRLLIEFCKQLGIEFLSSPFDHESAMMLTNLGLGTLKIPSGEITNIPFLKFIAGLKCKIILSTGMSTLCEVEEAVDVLLDNGIIDLTLLHCVTEYPAPYDQINLRAMLTLKTAFGLKVGYSDHSPGIEIPIAAVALGAEVIEKHFTLDKSFPGPDHKASLDVNEFNSMIKGIRNVERALGNGIKKPAQCELRNMDVARKSLVASCTIKKGEIFTTENITIKRPGFGLKPSMLTFLIGRPAQKDFSEDELLEI